MALAHTPEAHLSLKTFLFLFFSFSNHLKMPPFCLLEKDATSWPIGFIHTKTGGNNIPTKKINKKKLSKDFSKDNGLSIRLSLSSRCTSCLFPRLPLLLILPPVEAVYSLRTPLLGGSELYLLWWRCRLESITFTWLSSKASSSSSESSRRARGDRC